MRKQKPKLSAKTLRRKARAKQARRNNRKALNRWRRRVDQSAPTPAAMPAGLPSVPPFLGLDPASGLVGILSMAILARRKFPPRI